MSLKSSMSSMSLSDKFPKVTPEVVENVRHKMQDYQQKLKLIVYGDEDPVSYQMWKSIFRDDLDTYYSTDFPPIPAGRSEEELKNYLTCTADRELVWGLYNLAAPEHDPRMHLVLVNRKLKRSEFGLWAQTDELLSYKPTRRGSLSSSEFKEIYQFCQAYEAGGDSGPVSLFARSSEELSPPDGGDSGGMASSSAQNSQVSLVKDLSRTESVEVSESESMKESCAGDRSSRCSSAGLISWDSDGAHQDSRFISIESLRTLVTNLLDIQLVLRIPSEMTLSSLASSGGSGPQSAQALERSATEPPPDEDEPVMKWRIV